MPITATNSSDTMWVGVNVPQTIVQLSLSFMSSCGRADAHISDRIYDLFCVEFVLLKNDKFLSKLVVFYGGGEGIRTLATLSCPTRFRVTPLRPT